MRILAIETSCDETAAAVVEDGRRILSNVVASQVELHARFGGVFPELASREHIRRILPVIEEALDAPQSAQDELDAVAVTYGPGLAGSLLVGVNTAKALALAWDLPLIGINHLEAHIYANWLAPEGEGLDGLFPLLCLTVSGGHTDLVLMNGHGQYRLLGSTLDDAAGEAFDKVARLLGLGYPGGPAIESLARSGDRSAFPFPRARLLGSHDFSFSGLKTAVLRAVRTYQQPGQEVRRLRETVGQGVSEELPLADMAASFQWAVVEVLVEKTRRAAEEYDVGAVLLSGGVASNGLLRREMMEGLGRQVLLPPPELCTDNAAMVGAAAFYRLRTGQRSGWELDAVSGLRLE